VVTPKPTVTTVPKSAPVTSREPIQTRTPEPTQIVTRERYIERYNDSGFMGNPWFWYVMMNNDRGNSTNNYYGTQAQPTQVLVKDAEGQSVSVPENQLIVRKYSYSPIREFLVFSLGGGIGVLAARKFIR
jgi:hypothetical protein